MLSRCAGDGGATAMTGLVDNFMRIMSDQPLSLSLVAVMLLLLAYCFKLTNSFNKARSETMQLVVAWQRESQSIMANCVSKEVMDMVLKALERDRETYRAMLPSYRSPAQNTELSEMPLEKS
jgi:predicted benzoate:H+ symporter BenE